MLNKTLETGVPANFNTDIVPVTQLIKINASLMVFQVELNLHNNNMN